MTGSLQDITADRLRSNRIISTVAETASRIGVHIFLVGGPVRDMILGLQTYDYDFVVIGDLRRLVRELVRKLPDVQEPPVFSQFMTAKIALKDCVIDIAHAREESYPASAVLPRVKPCNSIERDLRRRDFTINAMAVSLNSTTFGKLIDPLGGLPDLRRKLIRVIYRDSFRDDPTRAFRAVRYSRRFDFRYSSETLREFELAGEYVGLLNFIRIKNELKRIAVEPNRAPMFREISQFRLLWGLQAKEDAIARLHKLLSPPRAHHWIAFFLLFVAQNPDVALQKAVQLTRSEKEALECFIKAFKLPNSLPITEIHRVFRNAGDECIAALAVIKNGSWHEYWLRRKGINPILTGKDLVKMGIPEGALIGEILKAIENRKLTGEIKSVEDEINFVKSYLNRGQ